ncbi:hypothetical protein OHB00_08390 [Streptomyces sp. NBC_00631]|uniref:hypothetical protein n=1 Tax=Streptomyces sp. NBC_00631 TaxID=2975793 RepID=UPI0030DECE24
MRGVIGYGLEVACLRTGRRLDRAAQVKYLATWPRLGDAVQASDALLRAPQWVNATVTGIAANTCAWRSGEPARSLGCLPKDDAEACADELIARYGELRALRLIEDLRASALPGRAPAAAAARTVDPRR